MQAQQGPVTLKNALVLAGDSVPMNLHGIYGADGAPAAQSMLHQGKRQITGHALLKDLPDAPPLQGSYIYGGMIAGHFGHMMLETFARLSVFETSDLPVIFSLVPQSKTTLFWTLATSMGLARDRIILVDAPRRIETLYVPPPDFEIRRRISPAFTKSYAARGAAMTARLGITENQNDTPAYLSRSKTARTGRYVFGETILEAILEANSVDIIRLEEMSFDDQVRTWATCRKLGGFTGSAFHPLLLTNGRKQLTYLTTHRVNRNFRLIEDHKSNASQFCRVKSNPIAAETLETGPYLLSRIGIVEACRAMGVAATLEDVPKPAYQRCVAAYRKITQS